MEIPMGATPNIPDKNQYIWPCYWGGVTYSTVPPIIHTGLRDLRRAVGSLAAKKQQGGPMFPVRSAKELMQKLAEALDELSLHAFPVAQDIHHFDTSTIPSNVTASGKPVFRTLAHVKSTVRIGAADGSYVDVVGSGHGGDVDDKSGGKADTYAWKSALLKGLSVPEQDMPDTDDEAPSERVSAASLKPSGAGPKPQKVLPGALNEPLAKGQESQLSAALARIKVATREELAAIKTEIQSGVLPLAGADKLKASAAFVSRGKKLDEVAQEEPK